MTKSNIEALKDCLYRKLQTSDDVSRLRQCLEKCGRSALQDWTDDNGYDVLHHAIMADNAEGMGMIFAMGHFKAPHEPKQHSYIHLAANFGNRSIVTMLMQERPRDYNLKKTKFKWVKKPSEIPLMTKDGCSKVSPLDVTANCGHVTCVKVILDLSSVQRISFDVDTSNHLSSASASNSPSALRLLLKQTPAAEDVRAAVGTSLKLANAECLDVLLSCNPRLTTLFSGMNLYHVFYSYSMSFQTEWFESLLTVTSVLLKHDQNPLTTVPFRTYPLYSLLSLLSHTPSSDFGRTLHYIIACMVVLLNANVDPNFNEQSFEEDHSDSCIQTAFGRSAFPSSLHCLFDNVRCLLKLFADDAVLIVHIRIFVTKATETLLMHGADLSICGAIEDTEYSGNALMAFLLVVIRLGMEEKAMTTFRLLTQNGSDTNISHNGCYPVNVFINEILNNTFLFKKNSERVQAMYKEHAFEVLDTLMKNMTQASLQAASEFEIGGKPTVDLQKTILKHYKKELKNRSQNVLSLKARCRLCVLERCNWKPTKVIELPLPLPLKKYINAVE